MSIVAGQPEPPWWAADDPSWAEADARRLVSLLSDAYPGPTTLPPGLGAPAFAASPEPDGAADPEEMWNSALRRAAGSKAVDEMIRVLLRDQWQKDSGNTLAIFLEEIMRSRSSRLEGMITPYDYPTDAITDRTLLDHLILRTATIDINGRFSGTGCLVGKGLLLTAQHVIELYREKLTQPDSIKVTFDFNHRTTATYAETGSQVGVVGVISHSPPTDDERLRTVDTDWGADADHLDYAILQLADPVPDALGGGELTERGYFPIRSDRYQPVEAERLTMAHHPRGQFLQFSHTLETPELDLKETRISYKCNTEPGSSGGPVVTTRGQLIALHHYASPTGNNGIPINAVTQDLRRKKFDYVIDQQDPENVVHSGQYTWHAREQVCRALCGDLTPVARHLGIPGFIEDSFQLWDWLAKRNKLRWLRKALEEAGLSDLVQILDADRAIVDQVQIDRIEELAEQIARSAVAADETRDFAVSMMRIRLLAEKLTGQVDRLPTFAYDDRLKLQWRTKWNSKRGATKSALKNLEESLPPIDAQAYQAQHRLALVLRFSRDLNSAVTSLHGLARSPGLAAQ